MGCDLGGGQDGAAKIGDVGLAKVMAEGYLTQDEALGTFAWAAPELLMGERCTEKVDVYSFGVVLWEVWHNNQPPRRVALFQSVWLSCGVW